MFDEPSGLEPLKIYLRILNTYRHKNIIEAHLEKNVTNIPPTTAFIFLSCSLLDPNIIVAPTIFYIELK